MRSLGVVIPTRDSMPLLPAHVESMRGWLDVAREIVVVDSDSRDGTVEFLRRALTGFPVRFVAHPPGLYESWNHGISLLDSEFTYVSTVGDAISRVGLLGLMAAAEHLTCDVMISPPAFINERGHPQHGNRWPIHRILQSLPLQEPAFIDPLTVFILALNFLPFAILGSSASNLYRTSVLQRNPFPIDFGNNGDGAWGLLNALRVRLGIFPACVSAFRRHKKSHRQPDTAHDADGRMLDLGMLEFRSQLARHPEWQPRVKELDLERIFAAKLVVQGWRTRLSNERRRIFPWCLNPIAWQARRRREQAQAHCQNLVQGLLRGPATAEIAAAGWAFKALSNPSASGGEPVAPPQPLVAGMPDRT